MSDSLPLPEHCRCFGTLLRLVAAVALAWSAHPALAQFAAETSGNGASPPNALQLQTSPWLSESVDPAVRDYLPVFIFGDRITGQQNLRTTIEGNAELRRGDTVMRADFMEYDQPEDLARLRGNVYLNRAGNVFRGDELELRVDAFEGFFTNVDYRLLFNGAHGTSTHIRFVDRYRSVIDDATYTTCPRDGENADWKPDWLIRARELTLDQEEEVGVARDARLIFMGLPVLRLPYISFPLSDQRKSGLLPPTLGISSQSGVEYTQPYYWNIAPNRDATLRLTGMSKRGVAAGGEFRYLEPWISGYVNADIMPNDRLRNDDRWGIATGHSALLDDALLPGMTFLQLDINRVSDNDYWRDFSLPESSAHLAERLLPSQFVANWAPSEYFTAMARAQQWQTLQDVDDIITPPYDRKPQLNMRYNRVDWGGFDVLLEGDYTHFVGDHNYTTQPDGKRSYALARVSYPVMTPGWFVTPRVQMHSTRYELEANTLNSSSTYTRHVPTFSLDSGLVFERDARYFGHGFRQTLEPRAFYVYTPYRDQSHLPNYDSAANDFNFASIYSENAYVGQDRIVDSNLLTLGVTTRLLDPDSGAEAVQLGVAQRFRFSDQMVTLPGEEPVRDRLSDTLLGGAINWSPEWSVNSVVQYNSKLRRSVRSTVGARYTPGPYRTISAAYRLNRGTSEQMDVGWQWPISNLWQGRGQHMGRLEPGGSRLYSVGRIVYSMTDDRVVDAVIGFEYESCCWIGRVVLERLQSSRDTSNTRLLLQIELAGFTRLSVGANPLSSLQGNIPRYRMLRDSVTTPSRFSDYE